jgi:hypothetical protein
MGALLILALFTPAAAFADPSSVAVPDGTSAGNAANVAASGGPLSDVPANSWAYDAVAQLVKDGIIKGYPDGTFKGNRPMTRYEAAVLAYRAVDMIEAQITAGKSVEKADIDAANKLIAAFGAELKTVERHVDALQKEADATKTESAATKSALAATDKRLTGQVGTLNDFTKRAYIKFTDIFRTFAYGGNVNANCGPGPYSGNGGSIGAYCASVGGGRALLPGVKTAGFGPSLGTPPAQNIANGQHNQGLGFNYMKLSFTGTPSANTAFLIEMTNSTRMATTSGTSTTTAYCTPQQNFLNGNPAQPATLTNCTAAVASQAPYADGEPGFLAGLNNVWLQQSLPGSGLYLRVGHIQVNEGKESAWLGGDYFWGGMLGITKGPLNAYVAYGVGNATNTNNTLNNIPAPVQKLVAWADYGFRVGHGVVNLGGLFMNYTGLPQSEWDPAAVICTGAGGQTRYFANTAAVPFTSCGAGLTPITYANGAPITGAYLSPAANNPTFSGTAAAPFSNSTPGLAVFQPLSMVGGHLAFNFGKARLYLAGTYRLGNDPYTGKAFVGPLAGFYELSFGPLKGAPGVHGKWTFESKGLAAQFNSLTPNDNYFGGPSLDNSWNTNFSGLYWVSAYARYWTSDDSSIALGFGHTGLMPNTVLPAGGVACPGCVVSGYTQNAGYLELNISI